MGLLVLCCHTLTVEGCLISVSVSLARYRADWEQARPSRRCTGGVLGVFRRCSAALWAPSTPNSTQVLWNPHLLKKRLIFPHACGSVLDLPHVAKHAFGSQPRHCHQYTACTAPLARSTGCPASLEIVAANLGQARCPATSFLTTCLPTLTDAYSTVPA